jgi:hypothetical protein
MSKSKLTPEQKQAEIQKLYAPDYFYEHGDNPANKKFMEIASANIYSGAQPDYRSTLFNNGAR